MKNSNLQYIRLQPNDNDIPYLLELYRLPEISQYIHIDFENYFHYVTGTDNVYYFKVILKNTLVATIHIEKKHDNLFLSILTVPEHQNQGIGTQILDDIKSKTFVQDFSKIIASIDKRNLSSIRLFEKAGYTLNCEEDELLEYCFRI